MTALPQLSCFLLSENVNSFSKCHSDSPRFLTEKKSAVPAFVQRAHLVVQCGEIENFQLVLSVLNLIALLLYVHPYDCNYSSNTYRNTKCFTGTRFMQVV